MAPSTNLVKAKIEGQHSPRHPGLSPQGTHPGTREQIRSTTGRVQGLAHSGTSHSGTAHSGTSHSGTDQPLIKASEYGDIFLSIVDRTGTGLAVLDPRLRIQETNMAFLEHCGTPPFDLCGRDFADLLHPTVRTYLMHRFDRLLHGDASRFVEHATVLWAARASFAGSLAVTAVRGESHRLKTVVVLVTPKTEEDKAHTVVSPKKILSSLDARILEGVAIGSSTLQLAGKLHLSRQGIEYHVTGMLRRFKAPNRAALVSKACSMGLFGVGTWPPKVLPEFVRS